MNASKTSAPVAVSTAAFDEPAATPIDRRRVLAAAGAGALAVGGLRASPVRAQTQKLTISVARLPFGTMGALLPVVMRDQQLLQKAAAKAGYELTVNFSDFPSGGPIAQGLVSQQIDFGPIGVTPLLNLMINDQQVSPISVAEGRLKFVIAVRKGSPVRNFEDLRGKTVAMIVGTDYQFSLASMLAAGLGTGSFTELGLKLVNVGTPAQLAAVPQGADAAIAHAHPFLKAQIELGSQAIANSYGYTEANYRGPLGEGAGHLLPQAKASPFWPESIYGHRAFWVVRNEILQKHPKLVTAFLVAQTQALDHLRGLGANKAAAIGQDSWGVPPDVGQDLVENDLVWRRGWAFATRGDVDMMWKQTQLVIENGVIKPRQPFTQEKLRASFAAAGEAEASAWGELGQKPSAAEFSDTKADFRGPPTWEADRWPPFS